MVRCNTPFGYSTVGDPFEEQGRGTEGIQHMVGPSINVSVGCIVLFGKERVQNFHVEFTHCLQELRPFVVSVVQAVGSKHSA